MHAHNTIKIDNILNIVFHAQISKTLSAKSIQNLPVRSPWMIRPRTCAKSMPWEFQIATHHAAQWENGARCRCSLWALLLHRSALWHTVRRGAQWEKHTHGCRWLPPGSVASYVSTGNPLITITEKNQNCKKRQWCLWRFMCPLSMHQFIEISICALGKKYVQTLRCRATRESLCAINGSVPCTAAKTLARTKLASFVWQ